MVLFWVDSFSFDLVDLICGFVFLFWVGFVWLRFDRFGLLIAVT